MVILLSLTACSFANSPKLYLCDIEICANKYRTYYVDFVQIYYKVNNTDYFIYEKHPTQENGKSIEFLEKFTSLQIPNLEIDLPENTDFTLYIYVSFHNETVGSNSLCINVFCNTSDIPALRTYVKKSVETENNETFNLTFIMRKSGE